MSAGVQTTAPLALGLLLDAAAPAANAGVSTTWPLALGLLLEGAGSGAATLSAAYGTPTSGTTATVGCTTDTASGTLYWAVTTSATPPSIADIKAGTGAVAFGSVAVSSTAPSASATGLTSNTQYWTHVVQTVAAVDSNVASSAADGWWTDNTGGGGGGLSSDAALAATGGSGTFSGTATGPAGVSMAVTGGSGTFSGSAAGTPVAPPGGRGPGYSARRRERWENEERIPQTVDLASLSTILVLLAEVGVFNG